MNNILPFRGKKYNENLAQKVMEAELVPIWDAARAYDEMQARTNAFYFDLLIKPNMDAINRALDTGVAANEEIEI